MLKGINNNINSIWVVGNGTSLNYRTLSKVYWNNYPGITFIDIPKDVMGKFYTVIAVLLDGKINLYTKVVGAAGTN